MDFTKITKQMTEAMLRNYGPSGAQRVSAPYTPERVVAEAEYILRQQTIITATQVAALDSHFNLV
jgi:hypothetical protein